MEKVLPRCVSLIVCRQVSVDTSTGRPTLEDLIQEFVAGPSGSWCERLVAWAEVEDGLGQFRARLRFTWAGEVPAAALQLASVEVDVSFTGPGQTRVLLLSVDRLPLPGPGEVELQLQFDGSVIMRRRLRALRSQPDVN